MPVLTDRTISDLREKLKLNWRRGEIPPEVLQKAGVPDFATYSRLQGVQPSSSGSQPYQPEGGLWGKVGGFLGGLLGKRQEVSRQLAQRQTQLQYKPEPAAVSIMRGAAKMGGAPSKAFEKYHAEVATPVGERVYGGAAEQFGWEKEPAITLPWGSLERPGEKAKIGLRGVATELAWAPFWYMPEARAPATTRVAMSGLLKRLPYEEILRQVMKAGGKKVTEGAARNLIREAGETIIRMADQDIVKLSAGKLTGKVSKKLGELREIKANIYEKIGMPKAFEGGDIGVQPGMFGGEQVVRPQPAGKAVQQDFETLARERAWKGAAESEVVKPAPKAPAVVERTIENWDSIPVTERVQWAKDVGLEGKVGSKEKAYLTANEKAALGQYPPAAVEETITRETIGRIKAAPPIEAGVLPGEKITPEASASFRAIAERGFAEGKSTKEIMSLRGPIPAAEARKIINQVKTGFGKAGFIERRKAPRVPVRRVTAAEVTEEIPEAWKALEKKPKLIKPKEAEVILPDRAARLERYKTMTPEELTGELNDVAKNLRNTEAEIAAMRETLSTDPVATFRGHIGKRPATLFNVLDKYGGFPEQVTVKQAEMLMQGRKVHPSHINPKTGKVPWAYVLDELTEHFRNRGLAFESEDDLIAHIEKMWKMKKDLPAAETRLANLYEEANDLRTALGRPTLGPAAPERPMPGQAKVQRLAGMPEPEAPGKLGPMAKKPGEPIPGQPQFGEEFEKLDEVRRKAQERIERFNKKFPDEAGGYGAADRGAISYLQGDDLSEAASQIENLGKLTEEQAKAAGIATIKQKNGKTAILSSRFGNSIPNKVDIGGRTYNTVDDLADLIEEIGYRSGRSQPPGSMFMNMDKGRYNGLLSKYIKQTAEKTKLAADKYAETMRANLHLLLDKYKLKYGIFGTKAIKNGDLFGIMQHISREEALNVEKVGLRELMGKRAIRDFIAKYPREEGVNLVRFARRCRLLMDDMIHDQNLFRLARGQDDILYRANYMPWVVETNIKARLFGFRKTMAEIMGETAPLPDFIKPSKFGNPRALARQGGMANYPMETDVVKLIEDYAVTASKDMFYTSFLDQSRLWTRLLRNKGFKVNAQLIDEFASEAFAGVLPAISRSIRGYISPTVLRAGFWARQRLNTAVFSWNLAWNFFVQPTAVPLTVLRQGGRNTFLGFDYIFRPSVRAICSKTYVMQIKTKAGGRLIYEGTGKTAQDIARSRGFLAKAENIATFLTSKIEEYLTGVGVSAALKKGKQMGLTGRELMHYASEGGARTQSMYNLEDLPAMLRSREVALVAPFQTFAFDVFTQIREISAIKGFKAGAYRSIAANTPYGQDLIRKRVVAVLSFIATIWAMNAISDKVTGRKPWQLNSFIPFLSVQMSGIDSTNKFNLPLMVRWSADFADALKAVWVYGNWTKMRKFVLGFTPGGVQAERMVEALTAYFSQEQGLKDVRGKTQFKIENGFELARALAFGPWTTEAGQEKSKVFREGKGPFYEFTQIPIPQRRDPKKELDAAYNMLGRPNPESLKGALFGMRDYASLANEIFWQSGERFKVAPELAQKWAEDNRIIDSYYDNIPASERSEYRRRNPEIDATLFFWGNVETLRTQKAISIVLEWMRRYNIPDTALPEISGGGIKLPRITKPRYTSKRRTYQPSYKPKVLTPLGR